MEAYRSAVEAGISPVEFWGLTPYLTRQATGALRDGDLTRAWIAAVLERKKKLPELSRLLSKKPEDKRDMAERLKAALSGVKTKASKNG